MANNSKKNKSKKKTTGAIKSALLNSTVSANLGTANIKYLPCAIGGIEFDMVEAEQLNYSSDVPTYPCEDGYSVSDNITVQPFTITMDLYISDTPVTWSTRKGHKPRIGRAKDMCGKLQEMYLKGDLVKVVTKDAVYKSMAISALTISKSPEEAGQRKINISLVKVIRTKRKSAKVPKDVLKSGSTKAQNGSAGISSESSSATSGSDGSNTSLTDDIKKTLGIGGSKDDKSILASAADALGF